MPWLRRPKFSWPIWTEATTWLLYTLAGMLVPVLSSLVVIVALGNQPSLGGFTDGGQFAIYSLGLWITVYRLIFAPRSIRHPGERAIAFVLLLGIFASFLIFLLGSLLSNGMAIRTDLIQIPSVVVFLASVVIAFGIVKSDSEREALDPAAEREARLDSLNQRFDEVD